MSALRRWAACPLTVLRVTLRLASLAQGRLDSIRLRASEFLARYDETRRSLLAWIPREKRRRDPPSLKLRRAGQRPPDPRADFARLLKPVAEGRPQ
jgi:hypothetical protein